MTEIDYTHHIISNFWAGEFSFGTQFSDCYAPNIPDKISYHNFNVSDNIDNIVLKIYAFLKIKNISFNNMGFLWECMDNSFHNEVEFKINIYKYDSSGKNFKIEVLQITDENKLFLNLYDQLWAFYQ